MNQEAEQIFNLLKSKFGDGILDMDLQSDMPVYALKKEILFDALNFLKSDPGTGFIFLTTLCGIHMPGRGEREFGMMYLLHNMQSNVRIRIKTWMSVSDMDVPSITSIWPAANWMERQEYDFFGFNFTGHPDLRRILNMDEMNYFPMRRQYPLEDASRDDKNDKMFGR